ncbi:hypothetical protein GCM10012279_38450 [Micromonospora yangpuensis]|nr:hypothetical protein GCM10012279_38450 [Micromonospora yangpuensis]
MGVLASPLVRFLHTSDWHLGRQLHGLSLHDAHQAFVDHLVDVARSERVDAVLIAGDLYDRAVPPPDAVGLWDQAQTRLVVEAGTSVVVIAGNHDSPARLGVGSRLLERAGVHVRVGTAAVGTPVLLEDDETRVACYPMPFLEPASAVTEWAVEERSHPGNEGHADRRLPRRRRTGHQDQLPGRSWRGVRLDVEEGHQSDG